MTAFDVVGNVEEAVNASVVIIKSKKEMKYSKEAVLQSLPRLNDNLLFSRLFKD